MKKLDRLGWAEGLVFSAFGVLVGVRVNVPGVLPRLVPLLPPGWKKSRTAVVQRLYSLMVGDRCERPGIRRLHVLYADIVRAARATVLDQVLEALETDLHRYTAEASHKMTFLHAGVVGWQGRAIVIPGRTLSGKTTLVRELLRLGASYYSDEFAVIDDAGLVHPFARPLGIREKGSYAQSKCTAEALGAATGVRPLPIGAVVIGEYKKGARWRPTALSQGQGSLELMANSVAIRNQPRQTLARIHKLARQAVFFKSARGEAREEAASILSLSNEYARTETA
jgi:hypothetical protein